MDEVGHESLVLAEVDPTDLASLHIQELVRARATGPDGTLEGVGVLEQFVLGDHEPTGLTGFTDGAPG